MRYNTDMQEIEFFTQNKNILIIIHAMSVVVGMGSAIISDILFTFYSQDKVLNPQERKTLDILSMTIWASLFAIVLSGIAIFFTNPNEYLVSQKFMTKIFIVLVIILNGLFLSKFMSPHFKDRGLLTNKSKKSLRQLAFAGGAVSLASWVIVFILGSIRSIPYTFGQAIAYYFAILLIGIIFSLLVENKTFSQK